MTTKNEELALKATLEWFKHTRASHHGSIPDLSTDDERLLNNAITAALNQKDIDHQAELEKLIGLDTAHGRSYVKALQTNAALKADLKLAMECLEFYEPAERYEAAGTICGIPVAQIQMDGGRRARETLAQINNASKKVEGL